MVGPSRSSNCLDSRWSTVNGVFIIFSIVWSFIGLTCKSIWKTSLRWSEESGRSSHFWLKSMTLEFVASVFDQFMKPINTPTTPHNKLPQRTRQTRQLFKLVFIIHTATTTPKINKHDLVCIYGSHAQWHPKQGECRASGSESYRSANAAPQCIESGPRCLQQVEPIGRKRQRDRIRFFGDGDGKSVLSVREVVCSVHGTNSVLWKYIFVQQQHTGEPWMSQVLVHN